MALQICLEDSLCNERRQCLYLIYVDRMDASTFRRMSEMLREYLEEPIRRSCVDLRLDDVYRRLLELFPKVELYPIDSYLTIAEMELKRLVVCRVCNGKLVKVRPYIEGETRLHELYP